MIHSFRKWFAAITFVALSCGFSTAGAKEPADIDLDEIARRLTQWRNSFINLRVVWELRSLPETDEAVNEWPPSPDPETATLFTRQEWIWADHGLDLLERHSSFFEDGSTEARMLEVFNGPKGIVFRAEFRKTTEGAPEELLELTRLGLGTGKPTSPQTRMPLYGLYWPGTAQWLPEILSEWDWKLDGIDEVGGEPCVRISAVQPYVKDVDFTEILWLDVNHDCLVRRRRTPAIAKRRAGWDFIVDEFQRLDTGTWFAKRGRIQLGRGMGRDGSQLPNENQLFMVTSATLNQSLDMARFEPPAPAVGTVVSEPGMPPYKFGATGAPAGPAAGMNASGQTSSHATNGNGPLKLSAAPPGAVARWGSVGLVSASIILLTIGLCLAHRKKEIRS